MGVHRLVPLINGKLTRQIFLDNAASTKPFEEVNDFVQEILPYYSNIHRGAGFDSAFCSQRYEEAREIIGNFVGWDRDRDVVISVRNTTEGLNLIANSIDFQPEERVITTVSEHHSNDLPWRRRAEVDYISIDRYGQLNLAQLEDLLKKASGKVKVVCFSGASNVTGIITPIYEIAAIAKQYGALAVLDGAQLIPHRRFDMRNKDENIDFVVFSGHKMNCPFGVGIVVGRKDIFSQSQPYQSGGGTVESVSLDNVIWAETPHKQEAGTPNIIGMLALARAIRVMEKTTMEEIEAREQKLTSLLLQELSSIAQVQILGFNKQISQTKRVGVVSFNIEGIHYGLVSAILAHEWGISVRHGCFCAQPLIKKLFEITPEQEQDLEKNIARGKRANLPGAVRVSLGIHNTQEEIQTLIQAVATIAKGQWQGTYQQDPISGEFKPANASFDFSGLPNFEGPIRTKELENAFIKKSSSQTQKWYQYPPLVNKVENRLVALGIVLIAAVASALDLPALIAYLVYEFLVQVLFGSKLSLLSLVVNRLLIPIFNLKPKLEPGSSKRFARGMGLFMTATALILYFGFNLTSWAYILLRCLTIAATLEFAFGFCIGCKIFQILVYLKILPREICPTCVDSQCELP
ncbi:MAG: aminotransferase class V-fold PLP-dependent enzyme [Prochloraceae cyanobacterium]|nr:aminotransferase class V-fold PLP-dependent enzyme [Prochloraceae cyanobacterium]